MRSPWLRGAMIRIWISSEIFSGLLQGLEDPGISCAPADVSFNGLHQLSERRLRIFLEKRGGRHEKSWSAVPALDGGIAYERFLDRIKRLILRQPLYGHDLGTFASNREVQTGIDRPAINQNRARAALAGLTIGFRSG